MMLLSVLLGLMALVFSTANAQACINGVLVNGLCTCYSGFTDTSCGTIANGTCPLPPAEPLLTTALGEFVSGSITNNQVSFTVVSPATSGRYFDQLQFTSSPNCSYPGNNFVKGFQVTNCSDTFAASIPFANIVNDCGFTLSTVGTDQVYLGILSVSAREPVVSPNGIKYDRNLASSLQLELTLPTTISLNVSNLIVYSTINLDAVVTKQIFDRNTDTVTIQLATSVQEPYNLLTANINLPYPFPTGQISYEHPVVCSAVTGACSQRTTITLHNVTKSNVCDVGGNYAMDWTYFCRTGSPVCAYTENQNASVAFTLAGSNLCGKLKVKAQLSGSIASYADVDATQAKSTFIDGTLSFYQVVLTSDVTIQSIAFSSIVVSDNDNPGNSVTLWNGVDISTLGTTAAFAIEAQTVGSKVVFEFKPSATLLGRAPGSTVAFTVVANVEVTYKTTFGRKRDVDTKALKFQSVGVMLPGAQSVLEGQSSQSTLARLTSSDFFIFAGLTFLGVLVFRKKLSNRLMSKHLF